MITIVAKNIIKEGKLEVFKALAEELINETIKEEGCISYNLNKDINNKNILTFIEEWQDIEAIKAHNNSAHFTKLVPELGKLTEKASEVNLYERV